MQHIAIIGGGLSGTLAAINLLQSKKACTVTIFERTKEQFSKGQAYSSVLPHQLLNVPAAGMSLFADDPDDFHNWLVKKGLGDQHKPADFVSRQLFGQYVAETFEAAKATSANEVNIVFAEIENVQPSTEGFVITTTGKATTQVHHVILGIGNLPPQELTGVEFKNDHNRFIQHPWQGDFLQSVGNADDVLLVGTGLTMVDVLLSLKKNGHTGKVYLLSRRGFLPQAHAHAPVYKLKLTSSFNHKTVFGLLAWLKAEIVLAEAEGANWISVLNAIREMTPSLWQNMAQIERQRFLRHLRPFWEVHRHRIPASSLEQIKKLLGDGSIEKFAGRIQRIAIDGDNFATTFTPKGTFGSQQLTTKWVVNCTGPNTSMNRSGNALINNLLSSRILHTDVTGTGLVVAEQFSGMHIIGPPARGTYWECTALREIRQHSAQVVDNILRGGKKELSTVAG